MLQDTSSDENEFSGEENGVEDAENNDLVEEKATVSLKV